MASVDKPKAYITGVGMITAVGGNAEMTAASVRAGINSYQESKYLNKLSNSIIMALIPDAALPELHPKLKSVSTLTARQSRMLRLATPAMHEVFVNCQKLAESVPLFLAGPEKIQDCPVPIDENFIDQLIIQTGVNINREDSRLITSGRAGGIEAIDMAFKYFEATGNDYAIVGGIDSYCDLHLLATLDRDNRVKVDGNMDAFVPSEAASFILLVSNRVEKSNNQWIVARIYQPGLSTEPGHRYSEEIYTGDGLANAFKQAIKNSGEKMIDSIYSSMNGENFAAKEYGVAITRNNKDFIEEISHTHPADCFGDIGAAFGTSLVVCVAIINKNSKLKKTSMLYCSSELDNRAAVCVTSY